MTSYPVKLKVYDLSRGMVKTWSPLVLGKTIEGIWHTAVVVYDMEYFYGGGILCLEPSDFENSYNISPVKIINMGTTEIDQSMFHDYLNSIQSQFSVDKYNLISWNCNHFTNEICNFLVGKGIPEHILNLPYDVMSTSQGKLILDMMQSYQTSIAPGFESNVTRGSNKNSVSSSTSKNVKNTNSSRADGNTDATKKVPSVNLENVFENYDKEKIKTFLDEFINNLKYNSDQKKKFLNTIAKCIDNIKIQPDNIKQRIIYKDNSNEIFKIISTIKEYDTILSLLGYHQASIEIDEHRKLCKYVIFLNTKHKTKINEHLQSFINKDLFLKKNDQTSPYIHVLHFKNVVDYIPYLEKNKEFKVKDAFIFISIFYISTMFNQSDVNNDLKHFKTVNDKVKTRSDEEKKELAALLELLKKYVNKVN